ncbi:MmpS family transport accessory protein [Rathayibacter sp. SD072]|uniref:MmpS family transport accessory protein n=1 Tax=Rathayibacter sp. SD072 TaxID=2781731 RepID=UPI001A974BAB|nr:MmpS family transport accessory protein [Rathayibacter sp. SD072]MBO0982317.1 hypothetical protein [Rathayibacter sp. SD072]
MSVPASTATPATKRSNGLGLAALIVGAVAFLFGVIPFLSFIAWLPALVAIGLGIAGLVVKHRKRLFAWIGLALGILAIIVGTVVSIASVAGVAQGISDAIETSTAAPLPEATTPAETAPSTEESAPAEAAAGTVKLQYEVTSDAATAGNITYLTYANGQSGQESATEAAVPFTKEIDVEANGAFDFSSFSLVAQASQDSTTISCKITYDGAVLAEQTSTGPFAVVSCNGTPQ